MSASRIRNGIFVTLCLVVFLAVAGYLVGKRANVLPVALNNGTQSILEGNLYQHRPIPSVETIRDGTFQQATERFLSDRFPGRNNALLANAFFQRMFITLANSFFRFSVYPTFFGSEITFSPKEEMLFATVPSVAEIKIDAIASASTVVTELVKTSETKVVVCITENPSLSNLNPTSQYLNNPVSTNYIVGKLFELLPSSPDNISVVVSTAATMEALKQRHFQTDGHWKISAAYDAYVRIAHELELEPRTSTQTFSFPQYDFIGQMSRAGLFFFENDDRIEDYALDYPEYELTYNGNSLERSPLKHEYHDGIAPDRVAKFGGGTPLMHEHFNDNAPYAMYGTYFGSNLGKGVLVYRQKELVEERENLLFITDSFGIPLEPMLASHYNETHVVMPTSFGDGFDIKRYIEQNNIGTVVLTSLSGNFVDEKQQDFFEYASSSLSGD